MSRVEFLLPDLGDGIAQAEVVSWKVHLGQHVEAHEVLVEVETDKALVGLPNPVTGTVVELGAAEGETIKLGELVAAFEADTVTESTPTETSLPGGGENSPGATVPEIALAQAVDVEPPSAESTHPPPLAGPSAGRRALAAPAVRQLARDLGIDLGTVPGTGPGGRIGREDVLSAAATPSAEATASGKTIAAAAEPSTTVPSDDREQTRTPLRGLRRTIARKMAETARTVPNVVGMCEVDVTETASVMQELKPLAQEQGVRLTWTAILALATIQALHEFPQLNASLDEAADEIVIHHRIHLGIATATDAGLLVPVIRNADSMSLLELAAAINRLSEAARDRKLQAAELTGSTFTVSNYGSVGGWFGTPLINLPEIGIVGFGAIAKRPAVVDDELAVRTMVAMSHAVDHRLIDGAVNTSFGSAIRRRLENPKLLLLGACHGDG